jgi:hypothetical protein
MPRLLIAHLCLIVFIKEKSMDGIACLLRDIRLQFLLLEKYLRSAIDIVGKLAPDLAFRVLKELTFQEF